MNDKYMNKYEVINNNYKLPRCITSDMKYIFHVSQCVYCI